MIKNLNKINALRNLKLELKLIKIEGYNDSLTWHKNILSQLELNEACLGIRRCKSRTTQIDRVSIYQSNICIMYSQTARGYLFKINVSINNMNDLYPSI